ncbi:cobyric acid synthase [Paenibacillus thalictri]|uniref:cobyric acid synthase n=1 Tax=Paenibacillus thalictri TaxID=2527873 RepID=UPI001F0FDB91|nr:cobyric acid synthase [Paenibacillus thalictri]
MLRAKTIMVQGTASDVGKSVLTAALCRIFYQDGWRVAPYKSQNMALNSYVTACGKEIGRAQGMQAEACGIEATTDMNPILLKPTRDMTAQIVVHGVPHEEMSARRYREDYLPLAAGIVREALDRLGAAYDLVVIEGAGSPAEINLKSRDIVNMRVAEWADAPVLLAADIDRGGVFAAIVGTLELLEPHERRRIKGFLINKFRGDLSLLQPGLDWLEQRTGIPVLGVIPHLAGLDIEAEDSVVLDKRSRGHNARSAGKELDVAVIRLPRISNFTDFDPLESEPDVGVRFVQEASDLGEPDIVVLPGSKNTLEDLAHLYDSGLARAITEAVAGGSRLVGICGGYQMLGVRLKDPEQVESLLEEVDGLGLLPLETTFYRHKKTVRAAGTSVSRHRRWQEWQGAPIEGYEIHMGQTTWLTPQAAPLFELNGGTDGAISEDGLVWGTYLHGVFHNDAFRRSWLNEVRSAKGLPPVTEVVSFHSRKTAAFDRLADHVRAHVDMAKLYDIIGMGAVKTSL